MLEPNDSELNLDTAEDACKSDYFSDEGEVKTDLPNTENGTSGKRKPIDIGFNDSKKVKVSENEIPVTDKTTKLLAGITSNNDFKRASSVASDNSDEFVDASDQLEPIPTVDKKPNSTDDVDASVTKNSASTEIPKSEPELPKVKGNKFISRLPTFADDPLDRFNSSAIRRGFFKEAEPAKPIDFNFDSNSNDKNEAKNESKIIRKVKLNRSKFFSTDKPKFSDDSSSDSNSKFNNSTLPVKLDIASSNDDKAIQSVKIENKIESSTVEEKITVENEPPPAALAQTEPESSLKTQPPVSADQNPPIDAENTPLEGPSNSSIEEKILDDVSEDRSIPQVEAEILETSPIDDAVSQPSEILDSNFDDVETNELVQKVDEVMEQSDIEPVSKIDEIINEEINEFPIIDTEPLVIQEIEPKSEAVSHEPESRLDESIELAPESELEAELVKPIETENEPEFEPEPDTEPKDESQVVKSIEPELESQLIESMEPEPGSLLVESIEAELDLPLIESIEPEPESQLIEPIESEPESQLIEPIEIEPESTAPEPLQIEPEPVQSTESPSSSIEPSFEPVEPPVVRTITSPVSQLNENEILEQTNNQVEKLDDGSLPLDNDSPQLTSVEPELQEPEQMSSVSESISLQEPILESELVSEILEPESIPIDTLLDAKEDNCPDPEPVQEPAVSEIIKEAEVLPEGEPQPHTDPEVPAQSVDLDITTESEDITDDKTEPEVSNEESEGEVEEEEEEEIHEEELYLEDRMPPISKPKASTPPPEHVPSPSAQKQVKDVVLIDDDDYEKDSQSCNQSVLSPPPVQQSIQATSAVENIENISVEQSDQSTPSMQHTPVEESVQPTPAVENIENIFVERSIQRTPSLENIENIPMDIDEEPEPIAAEPMPKELSKLEQALIGKPDIKRLEIQVPLEEVPAHFENASEPAPSTENEETKEKIKLRLSLQGDKVSIKKAPTVVSPTGEVRVKRQYRKRNKDGNLKPDKTYKLRNRNSKKDEAAAQETDKSKSNKSAAAAGTDKPINSEADKNTKNDRIYSAEPIIIDSDDSSKSGPSKVQPIKLKISKNSNVTIECGPPHSESDRNRDISEDTRKKDSIPNLMEQAATAWSGPDLQRVERLLKESNITITPVISKEASSSAPHSILKPMLAAGKEKQTTAPKFSTPSLTSTASSLQSTTACITPISRDKYDSSSSEHTSPQRSEHQNGEAYDHQRYRDGSETPTSAMDKQIDIKSEIRKMLASADKRKSDSRDSTDVESNASDSKPKLKAVPDLVPINLPTPEMLQTLASSLGSNTSSDGDPSADKSKPELDAAFLPLLQTFPKRRGRPTKAMVAAREALKQSQEAALENLKQLATQKASEGQPLPIPILDINDPEDLFKPKRGRKSRTERMDKSSDAEQSAPETTADPEREAEETKRLEEERIKKEEEKERRNEIRRQKARERNDLVKAKRLRQKMKAEERQKRMQEKRRKLQEEKKKLEEEIKNLPTSMPGFDDETRMSAENSQSQTVSFSTGMGDEDSSNATTELSQRVKKSRMEVTDIDSKDLTVDQIAEYQWPIQGGELYMIQEQVSNYLGVKSFKRKYPDIKRRPVDSEERAYLVDSGLVSETLCDLGLTAVSSAEVLDIMFADFPDKYEELRRHMRDKQMKELSFKQKAWANGLGYKLLMADGTKQDLKKRAMESASNWNSALNKSRSDDRRCAIDLQTFIVHYPKTRTRKMTMATPKMGSYPVSILPGQFCDFYKTYTSTELRYMPLNTVMYGPLKPHATAPGDGSQTDSDDSSSSDESSTSSEGTQATEDTMEDTDKDMSVDESSILDKTHDLTLLKEQMTMELSENTRELIMDETAKILCKVCLGNITRNKENVPEVLIYCSQCSSTSHPSCLDLSLDMVPHIKKYSWQCPDCKICARCKENADEDKMLFCDICDRGYHIYCVGLKKVPSGRWQCQECTTVENITVNNSTPLREKLKGPGLIDIQDG